MSSEGSKFNVHAIAKNGFTAGELYDRARPSYPSVALAHIRDAIKRTTPLNIVEIGAGTGIFTRALLAHPAWPSSSVHRLRAIEPSEGMRASFSNLVRDSRVSLSEGTFDHTGVEDGWADVIMIAQAFHWCPDYDKACTEFARILKPDGCVVFIWNFPDRDAARWVAQLRNRSEQHDTGAQTFLKGFWRQAFQTSSYQRFFAPPDEQVWSYSLPTTVDLCIDRLHSTSYIALLPDDEKKKVTEDVKAILQTSQDRVWIDESQGIFESPFKTCLVVSHRR